MTKKKGCICWPTIKRTGRSLRTSPDAEAAAAADIVKETCKASQLLSQGDEEEEEASIGKVSELQVSIPPEHDKFLEMLFPSSGSRQRSRTLSLTTSHHLQQQPKGKWTRFLRNENPPSASTASTPFRARALTSASSGGRRYPAPLGNDLLLLDFVPATPEAYSRRGFLASTLPLGLRSGATRSRTDEWQGYMGRPEQKKQLQKCQCSGCSDDICASSYKYPAAAAAAAAEDEEEEKEDLEQLVQLGPFFDNESYYNIHGCCSKARCKVSSYDHPMSRLQRPIRTALYDVPTSTDHRSVRCRSRGAFEKPFLHHQDAYRYKEDDEYEEVDDGDEVYHHDKVGYDRPIDRCRESYARQQPDDLHPSFPKVAGGDDVSRTAFDCHEKYDRPMKWLARDGTNGGGGGGGGARRGSKGGVVVCRGCMACDVKSEEVTAADQGWYQQMNAKTTTADANLRLRRRRRRQSSDDDSGYVLSDRAGTREDATNAFDFISPSQRTVGGLRQKGKEGVATRRDFSADESYPTPLSSTETKTNNEVDDKLDVYKAPQSGSGSGSRSWSGLGLRSGSPLSMRRFLDENNRRDASSKMENIQQCDDHIGSLSSHGDDDVDTHQRTETVTGQSDDCQSSANPSKSDACLDEKNDDGLQEEKADERPSAILLRQRNEAEGSSCLQLATDPAEALQDESREKEFIESPKNSDDTDANVAHRDEGEKRETNDRTMGGDASSTEEDMRATGSLLLGSQLDLLLMSPPPQCFYMANHSYANVAERKATSVGRRDVVVVHREMCAAAEHDSYDTRRHFRMKSRPKEEICCSKQKLKACKKHLALEEGEEFEVRRRQIPKDQQYFALLTKDPSEYDFSRPQQPPMDGYVRNTCFAN